MFQSAAEPDSWSFSLAAWRSIADETARVDASAAAALKVVSSAAKKLRRAAVLISISGMAH